MGLLDAVAERLQLLCQLAPVNHADELLAPVERLVGHGAPLAGPGRSPVFALHHVGDHRVGMELRVEIARDLVAEGGGHHLLAAGMHQQSSLRGLHAGPDRRLLQPRKRALHRGIVRGHDGCVVAHQGGQGDRFRGGEREVASGAMIDRPILPRPSQPAAGSVRHRAFEDVCEDVGVDVSAQPQRLGALAGPAAAVRMLRVVPCVVAVPLVVGDALRGRGDCADRDDHHCQSEG